MSTRSGSTSSESPLEGDRLESQCRHWREQLQRPEGSVDAETVAALQAQLVDPVQSWLKGKPRLLLSLSGDLWYTPLETLLPSERAARVTQGDLLRLAEGRWHPYHPGPSLALGAPESAGLEGARRELETVAQALPGCRLMVGNAATRTELLADAEQAHLIHLASHSYSNSADPLRGYLALADGPLTLPDIYGLHLDSGPVVVLSSCCSALGQDAPGSEPISLATAFSSAGAATVLSALWPADDEETREMFDFFYSQLARGRSPGEALREAQELSRKQHPKSRNWAAFVLNGCPD